MPRRSKTSRRFLASVAIATAGLIAGRAVGLVRSFLFVLLLPPEELGRWGIAYGTLPLIAWVLGLGLPAALARYGPALDGDSMRHLLRRVSLCTLACGVVALAVAIPARSLLAAGCFGSPRYAADALLLVCSAVLASWLNLAHGLFQGRRRFGTDTALQLLYTCLFAAGSLIALTVVRATATVALAVHVLATAAVLTGAVLIVLRLPAEAELQAAGRTLPSFRRLLWFSLGLCVGGLVEDVWPLVDRYVALHMMPGSLAARQSALGHYQIALTIASPLVLMLGALGIVLVPYAAQAFDRDGSPAADRKVGVVLRFSAVAFFVSGALLLQLAPLLLTSVLHDKGELWQAILPFCLAAGGLVGLQHVYKTAYVCREQAWRLVAIWLVMAMVNTLLSAYLVRYALLPGAAAASVLTGVLGSLLMASVLHGSVHVAWRRDLLALVLPAFLALPDEVLMWLLVGLVAILVATDWLFDDQDRQLLRALLCKLRFSGQQLAAEKSRSSSGPVPITEHL